jgi:mono/diheme cytochrome c family protein
MKVKFRWVALVFSCAFVVFAGILLQYMLKSIRASQAVVASEMKHKKEIKLAPATPSYNQGLELGGLIYVNQCAACHGSKATGATGPALIRPEWTFNQDNVLYIVGRIRTGSPDGRMPAFAGRIRDEDIAKVVSYIEAMNQSTRGKK